jgi:1,4-alpha-glucan branching enzyme
MPNTKSVSFRLDAPEAKSVTIVGDFNQWNQSARPLKQRKDGVWWVNLRLSPGTYQYKFVVDGSRWQEDPSNPNRMPDSHGGYNSVCEVA